VITVGHFQRSGDGQFSHIQSDPRASMTGTADSLVKMADTLRKVRATMVECYRRRTGQAEPTVSRWLSSEGSVRKAYAFVVSGASHGGVQARAG
jgi:hypothetical protein